MEHEKAVEGVKMEVDEECVDSGEESMDLDTGDDEVMQEHAIFEDGKPIDIDADDEQVKQEGANSSKDEGDNNFNSEDEVEIFMERRIFKSKKAKKAAKKEKKNNASRIAQEPTVVPIAATAVSEWPRLLWERVAQLQAERKSMRQPKPKKGHSSDAKLSMALRSGESYVAAAAAPSTKYINTEMEAKPSPAVTEPAVEDEPNWRPFNELPKPTAQQLREWRGMADRHAARGTYQ